MKKSEQLYKTYYFSFALKIGISTLFITVFDESASHPTKSDRKLEGGGRRFSAIYLARKGGVSPIKKDFFSNFRLANLLLAQS